MEYDVAADKSKAQEMIKKSGQMGVPVTIIGDVVVVGFNQSEFDSLLSQ